MRKKAIRFLPGHQHKPGQKRVGWRVSASVWLAYATFPAVNLRLMRPSAKDRAETDPVLLAHLQAVEDLYMAAEILAKQAGCNLKHTIALCRSVRRKEEAREDKMEAAK